MKMPVLSYTFLNTWGICPKQAYHRFLLRDIPFQETEAMRWGSRVHKALEERIRDGKPLPEDCARYEKFAAPFASLKPQTEMKVAIRKDGTACAYLADDVWLRGKIDVPVKQQTSAMITDWKTGKRREDPYEMELHGLMLQAVWPEVTRITGHYVWLQDGTIGKAHDLSNTGETLECLQEKADEIEMAHKRGDWPTKQGPLCGYCPVLSCNFNRVKDRR